MNIAKTAQPKTSIIEVAANWSKQNIGTVALCWGSAAGLHWIGDMLFNAGGTVIWIMALTSAVISLIKKR